MLYKKLLACGLTAALSCAALFGCSGSQDAQDDQGGQDAAQEQEAKDSSSSTAQEVHAGEPIEASMIADGTYNIEVESSSSMFRVVKAELTVQGDQMTCAMTLSGTGYEKLFMGTGDEALAADDDAFIPFEEDAEGAYVYTVPVEALESEIDCAAWSIRKEQWYDRVLVFKSDALPEGAVPSEPKAEGESGAPSAAANGQAAADLQAGKDGVYAVAVSLEGGSGKAMVTSPTEVAVADGAMTARIEWSSPNYDQMIVDGTQYLPVNEDGNSVFEIPVAELDRALDVQAETTAMSKPHMIDYKLTFDSASAQIKEA